MSSKATAVLKRIKFFQELEEGVQDKLPSIVKMEHFLLDTVIFQQGDPPGNCYVLLNGEVGVYSRESDMADFEESETPRRRNSIGNSKESRRNSKSSVLGSRRPSKGSRMESRRGSVMHHHHGHDDQAEAVYHHAMKEKMMEKLQQLSTHVQSDGSRNSLEQGFGDDDDEELEFTALESEKLLKIYQTTEGFSVYSSFEELGKQVAVLRGGTIFGELALINDQPRGASIRVLQDCDCLIIRRSDFDRVLKEEMQKAGDEKLNFLSIHMPGMRELEVPRFVQGKAVTHPAYFLRRVTYRRGQKLLTQGQVAQDTIYVVYKGCLEIRHREAAAVSLSPTSCVNILQRRRANKHHTMAMIGYSSNRPPEVAEGAPPPNKLLGTFMTGSVFGSLPMQAPEPYTVIVASPSVEVFQATGPDVAKLPRRLLDAVREYIAQSTAWRVRTYMTQKQPIELPKASVRSESPTVSGARTLQEAKYFSLIHAT
jgi:CRP-like cAMP-binding protein